MPEASTTTPEIVRFSVFELNLRSGELRKAGVKVSLQEQPLQTLVLLLERPGEVVTREELQQRLWPKDTFVDFEHGLNAVIKRLRDTLGDSADTPRFVETIPRRGYRFIASVDREPKVGAGDNAPTRRGSRSCAGWLGLPWSWRSRGSADCSCIGCGCRTPKAPRCTRRP